VRECQSLEAKQGGNLEVAAALLQFFTGNVSEGSGHAMFMCSILSFITSCLICWRPYIMNILILD
jgi:membrane-associated phospholipid phosphatase